eukprot:3265507-Amphidinium_carterae.1
MSYVMRRPRVSHHALLRLWISLDVASAQSYVIDTVVTKCYMQKEMACNQQLRVKVKHEYLCNQ